MPSRCRSPTRGRGSSSPTPCMRACARCCSPRRRRRLVTLAIPGPDRAERLGLFRSVLYPVDEAVDEEIRLARLVSPALPRGRPPRPWRVPPRALPGATRQHLHLDLLRRTRVPRSGRELRAHGDAGGAPGARAPRRTAPPPAGARARHPPAITPSSRRRCERPSQRGSTIFAIRVIVAPNDDVLAGLDPGDRARAVTSSHRQ